MKSIIHFSRAFLPAALVSTALIIAGITGYIIKGGFNLGVDFQAGFIQEVQFAPTAFTVKYAGRGDATINFSRDGSKNGGINIIISGANIDGATYRFDFDQYPTLQSLQTAMTAGVEGLTVDLAASGTISSQYLVQSAQGNPELNADIPFTVHYLEPDAQPIPIEQVRAALSGIDIASIQILGAPAERRFLIRVDAEERASSSPRAGAVSKESDSFSKESDSFSKESGSFSKESDSFSKESDSFSKESDSFSKESDSFSKESGSFSKESDSVSKESDSVSEESGSVSEAAAAAIPSDTSRTLDESVNALLQKTFGKGGVAITRSDFVGSRFSKQLANQAGILLGLTLLLILIYASVRFKPQFAIGAVLAIAHDALIMVAFIAWTQMEFNTTTIAAILTILGYSINDTIVIFDRVRETRLLYPDDMFNGVLDRAITETLSRTVITTLTTMLAVLSLYIFTTRGLYQSGLEIREKILLVLSEHNTMKDFAFALLVGMISGVYSTIFIACGWTSFWDKNIKREKA
ncbi:MAG: protein translocase subunit SecF [Spirochaetaceae bacterium]|jgi:preprotein translocase SecF subunit|nr:protein translocase subunit SecF [Spirochaetaceae bacterium]